MSKVYDALLLEMQERLNRVRSPSSQVIRLKENEAITLSEELDQFQKNVGDQITRFKNAIAEGEAVVSNDIRNTAETMQKGKDDIAALEEQVRVGEERLRAQQAETKQLHEQLSCKIQELERELFETARIVAEKESDIQLATERSAAGTREFKEESRKKENLLKARDMEITKLRGQIQLLTRGVNEMSSFFTQVGAFGDSDSRELLEAITAANQEELIPDCPGPLTQTRSTAANLTEDAMPAQFCHDLAAELTDVVGPIAGVMLSDQLKALGASVDALPKERVTELLDLLADEILEPRAKAHFRARFSHYNSQIKGETAVSQ